MAKDKDSKSEAVPGGTKASDVPAKFGGTKGDAPANPPGDDTTPTGRAAGTPPDVERGEGDGPESRAPVTTDAAAHTPTAPGAMGPPNPFADPARRRQAEGVNPSVGRRDSIPAEMRHPGDDTGRGGPSGFTGAAGGRLAGDHGEVTVADLMARFRDFAAAVRSREWSNVFRVGASIVSVFSDLMDGPGLFGVTLEDAQALEKTDEVAAELASARNELTAGIATARRQRWEGGDPHPLSGSPMPTGSPKGAEAGFIDPQTLLVIFELISRVFEMFRRR